MSSEQQKEAQTIESQVSNLLEFAELKHYQVPPEWVFRDEGYSGSILERPGLDKIRDLAAEQQLGKKKEIISHNIIPFLLSLD